MYAKQLPSSPVARCLDMVRESGYGQLLVTQDRAYLYTIRADVAYGAPSLPSLKLHASQSHRLDASQNSSHIVWQKSGILSIY